MLLRALLACALLVAALAARTYGLFGSSIWGDDVLSISDATGHSLDVWLDGMVAGETYIDPPGTVPASFFLQYLHPQPGNNSWRVARDVFASETHPPLFFVLLHLWMRPFGYTVAAGRAFSLLFSLAALPVLFFLAQRLAGETAAWIAALLCAMAPFQANLAIQVRGYSLYSFLALATAALTFEILERGPTPRRVGGLTLLGIAGIWTHYYFAIYSFLQGLALLTQRRLLRTAVTVGVIWAAALGGLAYYFLVQPASLSQPWIHGSWEAPLLFLNASAGVTDLLVLSPEESLKVLLAGTPLLVTAIKFLFVFTVGALLLVAVRHLAPRHSLFLLAWLAGPVALIFALDMVRHSGTVTTTRHFAGSSFAFYLLLAAGLAHLKPLLRGAGTTFLVLVMLAGQVALRISPASLGTESYDPRRAAMEIGGQWKPQDLVIMFSEYGSTVVSLAYYLPPQTPMLSLVYMPRAERGPVVAPANLDDLGPRLDQGVAAIPHLWVVRCFADSSTSLKLDAWLAGRYRTVGVRRYGSLYLKEMVSK
jgi:uncharacterized membrane protein